MRSCVTRHQKGYDFYSHGLVETPIIRGRIIIEDREGANTHLQEANQNWFTTIYFATKSASGCNGDRRAAGTLLE